MPSGRDAGSPEKNAADTNPADTNPADTDSADTDSAATDAADTSAGRTKAAGSAAHPFPVVIRLPRTTYLAVLFVLLGSIPIAFSAGQTQSVREATNGSDPGVAFGPQLLVLLLPVIVAVFIARTATVVTEAGLKVRAAFGSRMLPWESLRGLAVRGRSIYAVQDAGVTRLPCVRLAHLGPLSRMSGGHLPELADAAVKPAPGRRRR